ncbi:MAG: hypothetical protein E7270_10800 [Lachnospiraceae bacterium]|nr:hypothetical protein [Lachnospiraceae bacterium]
MFEKIYMHSGYEQKRNKIWGLKEYACLFLMGIPFILLGISIFAYYCRTLSTAEFTVAFTITLIAWTIIIGLHVVNYIKNSTKVFAVGKNKKVYVMNISKEAASYLSLNTAMQNMSKASGKPGMEAVKAMSKTAADAFKEIEESDVENRIESAGLCIDDVERIVRKRKCIVVYGKWMKKSKLVIPLIYSEVNELEKYFEHMSKKNEQEFEFHKKTKEDVLSERIKKNPNRLFISIFCLVLWLFVYNFANDLNRMAHIKHNFDKTEATIESIEKNDEIKISYKKNSEEINVKVDKNTFSGNIKEGDIINIYYDKTDEKNIIEVSKVGFLIKPFVVLLLAFEIVALVIRVFAKKS